MTALRAIPATVVRWRRTCRTQLRLISYGMAAMTCIALAGCAAYQDIVTLDLRSAIPEEAMVSKGPRLDFRVAVPPFRDHRARPNSIGRYTRFWGKQVPLVLEGPDLGETLALDTIDYLKIMKGWQTWIDKPDIIVPAKGTDLRLSGYVMEWVTDATDWGVLTKVQTKLILDVYVEELKDQRSLPVHIVKEDAAWMMGFDARELGKELTELFHRGLDEFLERSRSLLPAGTSEGQR